MVMLALEMIEEMMTTEMIDQVSLLEKFLISIELQILTKIIPMKLLF